MEFSNICANVYQGTSDQTVKKVSSYIISKVKKVTWKHPSANAWIWMQNVMIIYEGACALFVINE